MAEAGRSALAHVPLDWLTPRRLKNRLARNRLLRDRHAGQRCFILGNGPSLATQDLSGIAGEILISCNSGHVFTRSRGLAATYHAVVDDVFARHENAWFLDEMRELERAGTTLLTSLRIADALAARDAPEKVFAVHQILASDFPRSRVDRMPDLTRAQFGYLSVIHMSIACALYMGFREIYLLGCDMDYFVDPQRTFEHSYGDARLGEGGLSASELFGWDQVELMTWCLREFRAFDALGRTAELNGRRIFNAGVGGALNVFPRVELERLVTVDRRRQA